MSLIAGAVLTLVLVGMPLLAVPGVAGVPVGALERRRLRIMDAEPARTPIASRAAGARARGSARASGSRRRGGHLAYTGLLAVVLGPIELIAVTYGLVVPLVMICAPISVAEAGHIVLLKFWPLDRSPRRSPPRSWGSWCSCGGLPDHRPRDRARPAGPVAAHARESDGRAARRATRSRSRLVEAFEAERRRIERDLHDGAQQRLVALTMTLGLAKSPRPGRGGRARGQGAQEAKLALARSAT